MIKITVEYLIVRELSEQTGIIFYVQHNNHIFQMFLVSPILQQQIQMEDVQINIHWLKIQIFVILNKKKIYLK